MGNKSQIEKIKEVYFSKDLYSNYFHPLSRTVDLKLKSSLNQNNDEIKNSSIISNGKIYTISNDKPYFIKEQQRKNLKNEDELDIIKDFQTSDYLHADNELVIMNTFINRKKIIRFNRYYNPKNFKCTFSKCISEYFSQTSILSYDQILNHFSDRQYKSIYFSKLLEDFRKSTFMVDKHFNHFLNEYYSYFFNNLSDNYISYKKIIEITKQIIISLCLEKELKISNLDKLILNISYTGNSSKEDLSYIENLKLISFWVLNVINDENDFYDMVNSLLSELISFVHKNKNSNFDFSKLSKENKESLDILFVVQFINYILKEISDFDKNDADENFKVLHEFLNTNENNKKENQNKNQNSKEKDIEVKCLYKVLIFENNLEYDNYDFFKSLNLEHLLQNNIKTTNESIHNDLNSKDILINEIDEDDRMDYRSSLFSTKQSNHKKHSKVKSKTSGKIMKLDDEFEDDVNENHVGFTMYSNSNDISSHNENNCNKLYYSENNNHDYKLFYNNIKENEIISTQQYTSFTKNINKLLEKQEFFLTRKNSFKAKLIFIEISLKNNYSKPGYFKSKNFKTNYFELNHVDLMFYGEDEVIFLPFSTFRVREVTEDYICSQTNIRYDLKINLTFIEESEPYFSLSFLYHNFYDFSNVNSKLKENNKNQMKIKMKLSYLDLNKDRYIHKENEIILKNELDINVNKSKNITIIKDIKMIDMIQEKRLGNDDTCLGLLNCIYFSHNIKNFKIDLPSTINLIFKLENLEYLNLSENKLNNELLIRLGNGIGKLKYLIYLNLNNNDIGSEYYCYTSLAEGISTLIKLEFLSLEYCSLNDTSIKVLMKKIQKLIYLSYISLANNFIENYILDLRQFMFLEELNINKNIFSPKAINEFFDVSNLSEIGSSLKCLDISDIIGNQEITDNKSLFRIASHLKFFPLLEEINLSNNKLYDQSYSNEFFDLLFNRLTTLSFLRIINLSYMEIPFSSFIWITQSIQKFSLLEQLYIFDIKFNHFENDNIENNGSNVNPFQSSDDDTNKSDKNKNLQTKIIESMTNLYVNLNKLTNFKSLYLNYFDFTEFNGLLDNIDVETKFEIYINENNQ